MGKLDDLAKKVLTELKLPTIFSYRQAFIAGYNARKELEYRVLYGAKGTSDSVMLLNNDPEEKVE